MKHLENILDISLQEVLKMSWRCLKSVFARRLEGVFKTSWRRLEEVLKTSWRPIEDVRWRRIYWSWPRRLEDERLRWIYLSWSRRSSEDKDERRLQDVFIKTNLCWVIALDCRQSKYLITIFLNFRLGFCGSFFLC